MSDGSERHRHAAGRRDTSLPRREQAPEEQAPEEQVARYQQEIDRQMRQLPQLAQQLEELLGAVIHDDPVGNAQVLSDGLHGHRSALIRLLNSLNRTLDLAPEDSELLRERIAELEGERTDAWRKLFALEQAHEALQQRYEAQSQALAYTRGELSDAQLQSHKLDQELDRLQQEVGRARPLIIGLEQEKVTLEERVADLEQRSTTQPGEFGRALGRAVDVIQGLTTLENPYVDYGLQELDLQTQVNIQLDGGELNIRFPGLNEVIAPQNLSQLHLRLRPIPKSQQAPFEPPDATPGSERIISNPA